MCRASEIGRDVEGDFEAVSSQSIFSYDQCCPRFSQWADGVSNKGWILLPNSAFYRRRRRLLGKTFADGGAPVNYVVRQARPFAEGIFEYAQSTVQGLGFGQC